MLRFPMRAYVADKVGPNRCLLPLDWERPRPPQAPSNVGPQPIPRKRWLRYNCVSEAMKRKYHRLKRVCASSAVEIT
jgi:hypothetical protein